MNYEDYTKEDIAEMQRVVCDKIKYNLSQSYPDIKCHIDVWEHFDYVNGEKLPTFKIRGLATEIVGEILNVELQPKRSAHFEYCFTDIKSFSTDEKN